MPEMQEGQTHIQFILPDEAKLAVQRQAKAERISSSALIRKALQEYFDKRGVDADFDAGISTYGISGED